MFTKEEYITIVDVLDKELDMVNDCIEKVSDLISELHSTTCDTIKESHKQHRRDLLTQQYHLKQSLTKVKNIFKLVGFSSK